MIDYDHPMIRPPSEADSLILQATLGCSHNRCAFCVSYRTKRFRVRPERELFAEIDWASAALPGTRRVFLADGDALAMGRDRMLRLLHRLRRAFPDLQRVASYASPGNFRHLGVEELTELRQAGLTLLYIGLESGEEEVLRRIDKGFTPAEMAELCALPGRAGMKISVTLILGLGGPRLSRAHALATARLVDTLRPRYASALTLMLPPREPPFARVFDDPRWRLLEPEEMLLELRTMLAAMEADGIIFRSNHASNWLALAGTMQRDKERLLAAIDSALADPGARRADFLRGL